MIGDKTVVAIIPARGNSKGLPGKNIRMLCGKPLIAWSIEVALQSSFVDTVITSTDSQAIADIAKQAGATVPFLRPARLATDEAATIDVVDHVLESCRATTGEPFDYVVLLEPTSPLREGDDVDVMLRKLHDHAASFDSIVSVGEVGEHPSIMKRLVGDSMEPFCAELQKPGRRQ